MAVEKTQEETHEDEETHEEEEHAEEETEEQPLTAEAIAEAVAPQMESIVDRRITSLMKTLQTDYGLAKQAPAKKEEVSTQPAPTLMLDGRLLRLSVQEELNLAEFETRDERKAARDLALQMAKQTRLEDTDDPDEVAKEIVESVSKTMATMKDTYQTQLREDLKRRGALRDDEETEQPSKTKTTPVKDAQKQFDRGAELAREKYGTKTA